MNRSLILPESLVSDKRIPPRARLLYVAIHIYNPRSISELSLYVGMSRTSVTKGLGALSALGWVYSSRNGRRLMPVAAIPYSEQEKMASRLQEGFAVSRLKGEYLMGKWLQYLVVSDDYIDNARPPFLQNPLTGEPLELDRYYPDLKCGFEHHGPQHFGPTKVFPSQDDFRATRARDLMKKGLCEENNISLIIVTAEDLSLEKMVAKIPKHILTRQIDPDGPYAKALTELSAEYLAILSKSMSGGIRRS